MRHLAGQKNMVTNGLRTLRFPKPRGEISWFFLPFKCAFTQRKLSVFKILTSFVFNPRNVKKTRNQDLSQTGFQNLDMGMKVSKIPTTFHITVRQPYKIRKRKSWNLSMLRLNSAMLLVTNVFHCLNMNERKLYQTCGLQSNFLLSVSTVSYYSIFRLKTFLYGDWFLLDKFR